MHIANKAGITSVRRNCIHAETCAEILMNSEKGSINKNIPMKSNKNLPNLSLQIWLIFNCPFIAVKNARTTMRNEFKLNEAIGERTISGTKTRTAMKQTNPYLKLRQDKNVCIMIIKYEITIIVLSTCLMKKSFL